MPRTVAALFDTLEAARAALRDLVDRGVDRGAITLAFREGDETAFFAERVARGGVLVVVRAPDDGTPAVEELLRGHGAVDVHARWESWRDRGWRGPQPIGPALDPGEAAAPAVPGLLDFGDAEPEYRRHCAGSGAEWLTVEPAYRFGHDAGLHERYAGRPFEHVASDLRSRWERVSPGTWDRVKGAVAHAFDRSGSQG